MIIRTASFTSHSAVLMCNSASSGASYGAEIPVNSESSGDHLSCLRTPPSRRVPLISPSLAFL